MDVWRQRILGLADDRKRSKQEDAQSDIHKAISLGDHVEIPRR
jgi:hypothetical protein